MNFKYKFAIILSAEQLETSLKWWVDNLDFNVLSYKNDYTLLQNEECLIIFYG